MIDNLPKEKKWQKAQKGLTLLELFVAMVGSALVAAIGYTAYLNNVRQHKIQSDRGLVQSHVTFLSQRTRDFIVSAGGGLPYEVSGFIPSTNGLCTYFNPSNKSTTVDQAQNTNLNDSRVPVDDASIFTGYSHVYAKGVVDTIAKIKNINVTTNQLRLEIDEATVVPSALYPLEMTFLYLDADSLKYTDVCGEYTGMPLAIWVSEFEVLYDISSDGTGAFVSDLPKGHTVSRARIVLKVVAPGNSDHPGLTRQLKTTVGIRKGRI